MSGTKTVGLEQLIQAALTDQPYNQIRLDRDVRRYSRTISMARARDLDDDLHQEVCQEAFITLWAAGPAQLNLRSGKSNLRRAVLAAIRSVRAKYARPGRRTRQVADDIEWVVAAEHIGLVPERETVARAIVGEGDHRSIDLDLLPSEQAARELQQTEDRRDIEIVLTKASPFVGRLLRDIYVHDVPVEVVARFAHMSRFVLHRRLSSFYAEWREAA